MYLVQCLSRVRQGNSGETTNKFICNIKAFFTEVYSELQESRLFSFLLVCIKLKILMNKKASQEDAYCMLALTVIQ